MSLVATATTAAALAVLALVGSAHAQVLPTDPDHPDYPFPPKAGMVRNAEGEWKKPTMEHVLQLLGMSDMEWVERYTLLGGEGVERPAVAILRQELEGYPRAAREGLADRLADMMADTSLPVYTRVNASSALALAATEHGGETGTPGGTPYRRGLDLLIEVYETGGHQRGLLSSIFHVSPDGRGGDYVRDMFERSERPPHCSKGHGRKRPGDRPPCERRHTDLPWCRAGHVLYYDIIDEARRGSFPSGYWHWAGDRPPMPDGLPDHVADFFQRCK